MELDGAVQAITSELRLNAELVAPCEPHGHAVRPADVADTFVTRQWDHHSRELATLRRLGQEELVDEAESAYKALKMSQARGALPPLSSELLALADRFREIKL